MIEHDCDPNTVGGDRPGTLSGRLALLLVFGQAACAHGSLVGQENSAPLRGAGSLNY